MAQYTERGVFFAQQPGRDLQFAQITGRGVLLAQRIEAHAMVAAKCQRSEVESTVAAANEMTRLLDLIAPGAEHEEVMGHIGLTASSWLRGGGISGQGGDLHLRDASIAAATWLVWAGARMEHPGVLTSDQVVRAGTYENTPLVHAVLSDRLDLQYRFLAPRVLRNAVRSCGVPVSFVARWGIKRGMTLAHCAMEARHLEAVGVLLELGADFRFPDRRGVTPLTHAARCGFEEGVALVHAYEARQAAEAAVRSRSVPMLISGQHA